MAYSEHNANDRELSLFSLATAQSCEIVKDCIVPDTYTDVKKILATTMKLSPRADSIEEGGVVYGGELTATVLCLCEDGEIASLTLESEYEGRITLPENDSYFRAVSFPSTENAQSRLINPRKIGIRAKIRPELYLFEDVDTAVRYPDAVTDEDRMTFEEKYARVGYTKLMSFTISGVESGDDIHIDAPYPAIGTILMKTVSFSAISAEAREGAVAVNATADIALWYRGEGKNADGMLCVYRHSLPISKLVEADGVKEGQTVTAALYWEDGSFSPADDSMGECRVCECDFTYGVTVAAFSPAVGYVTKDIYSIRYDAEPTFGEYRVCESFMKTATSSRIRTVLTKKEGYQPIAAEGILKQYHVEAGDDARAVIAGSVLASVVLQNRESLQYTSETVEIPFTLLLSMPYREGDHYAISTSFGVVDAREAGGEITLSQSLSCTALAFSLGTERAVIAATPTAECAAEANASFTVYYPGRDETPWDIAKKYRVREEDLILHEPKTFSEATRRTAVLIPARRYALYRRVVEE